MNSSDEDAADGGGLVAKISDIVCMRVQVQMESLMDTLLEKGVFERYQGSQELRVNAQQRDITGKSLTQRMR
jgi:hypothetical protein